LASSSAASGPELFGFIDSLEAIDINSPGLEFLEGSHFWEGMPRYLQADAPDYERFYRDAVGIDENGASVNDANDVSTAAHMFGCWETLFIIKEAMEAAGYSGPEDRAALVEATEALERFDAGEEHPQGDKIFVPRNPPVLRPTEHLGTARRPARRHPPDLDRGFDVRAGSRLPDQEL
jgi:branched-chain amino acid transport system substrate-binding protein